MKRTICALMILVMLLGLCACGGSPLGSKVQYEDIIITAYEDEDGTAYIPLMNGESVKIAGEVTSARISQDRRTVIVLEKDGTLYYADPALTNKHQVADDADSIRISRNDGFLYTNKEDHLIRVLFADGSTYDMGEWLAVGCSDETFNLAYVGANRNVYILPLEADEGEKIGSVDEKTSVFVRNVSRDGSSALWVEQSGDQDVVMLYENGEKSKFCTFTTSYQPKYYSYSATVVDRNSDESVLTVYNYYSSEMFVRVGNGDVQRVKLGNEPQSSVALCSADGEMGPYAAKDLTDLYIVLSGNNSDNLYWVGMDGEREKLLGGLTDEWEIAGGNFYYVDEDDVLYYAKLNGASMEEPTKIASDVYSIYVPSAGGYIYYLRNVEDGEGTLYAYKIGDKEPTRVSGSVSTRNITLGIDGKSVYYFKDVESIKDHKYDYTGTLYQFTFGKEEDVKIASDVITSTIVTGNDRYEVLSSGFGYMKYSGSTSSKILSNWCFFDGKESSTFARDVVYYQDLSAAEEGPAT